MNEFKVQKSSFLSDIKAFDLLEYKTMNPKDYCSLLNRGMPLS